MNRINAYKTVRVKREIEQRSWRRYMDSGYGMNAKLKRCTRGGFVKTYPVYTTEAPGKVPAKKTDKSLATFTRRHPVPQSKLICSSSSRSTKAAEAEVAGARYSPERSVPIADTTARFFGIKSTRLYG